MSLAGTFDARSADQKLYLTCVLLILVAAGACVYLQNPLPFVVPAALILALAVIPDFRRLFYLLFAILPFSAEFYFENVGLGTDIPSEPVMILLSGIAIALLLRNKLSMHKEYVANPVFILILLHVFWIFVTTINSQNHLVSFKFLLAKLWYIAPFFILPLLFAKEVHDLEKGYRILYRFLFVSIVIVLIRHAFEGFTFEASYDVVRPFFRNHVNYAAICVVCLPFVWAFHRINVMENKASMGMNVVFLVFITGIYFSFTRAAILSMAIAWGAYYIILRRWVRQALLISSFVAAAGIIFLSWDNKYMDFAPDFEKTITHTEFDNLLEATYKLEDISSMERVYRWMAGVEMIRDKFWLGFGPGCFYSNYQAYSISSFKTYVSNNPDQSGIHNYFLMTWVEQGFVGFVLFLLLCFVLLIEGEAAYHRCTDRRDRYLIMATTLGFIIIFAMCLINDLIETDKVGPFFFFNAAILLFFRKKYGAGQKSSPKLR